MDKLVNKLCNTMAGIKATVGNNSKAIFYSRIDCFMADLFFSII